jgi:hypothetical protein
LGEIDRIGRTTLTSGQQADSARFHARLQLILKANYESFEDDFERFISDFDHIFFNTFGDQTIDSLLESRSWQTFSEGMRGVALEQSLQKLYENASQNFGIDITRVSNPAQRELIQNWVRKNMDALKEQVGKVQSLTATDRIRTAIYYNLPDSLRSKLFARLKESE